jgi:hypothetical protein
MKLYLAGGYGIMNVVGRERQVSNMMPTWKRLFSYNFLHLIYKSEILILKHEDLSGVSRTKGINNDKKNTL